MKIHFINVKGETYDQAEFYLIENETIADRLEEVLYIMQEITPLHNEWKTELFQFGSTTFTYHMCEFVHVSKKDDDTFYVVDIQ